MNIAEMHVWFRQYAQQMGMQNVRAILPEQIDVLINTAISDVVNQLVRENVGLKNDRVVTDSSKINQINALRTLYKVEVLDMCPNNPTAGTVGNENPDTRVFDFDAADILTGKMSTNYARANTLKDGELIPDYLYLVDFSLNYRRSNTGFTGVPDEAGVINYVKPVFGSNAIITNYFPVRLIEDAYLADTLNDFVLKNRIRTPILVTYNNGTFDLYIDEFVQNVVTGTNAGTYYTLQNGLIPYKFRMSYIAKPAKVKYVSDIGGENTDCDLPESMHVDILKYAVDLYNISLQGGLYANQQNQQAQQREIARNEQRPVNEGYQQ